MKYIVAFALAVASVSFAVPAAAQQTGDTACWQAFKKNKPNCVQKSKQERGGSVSVQEAASGKASTPVGRSEPDRP